ncbi:hypothetical protein CONLIGDRAFT_633328 [Coniochaeta ligniaria NRRL 30616]|uniref:Uncharacterized protein n=1 Tax=Coniochaeta ligniaria NRRL 30616 TaxID=1408157 RepID=A0A1J7IPP5_9PEZI|nr:hypothetical protein CONLIGDRAFT_633328 [Coniochaeta ligniaria NRRL 30616]
MSSESPEQLLDAFKAAALSVTKLYKTSAAAQAKARADGYQDCLDDILSFLDKENIGLSDGEGWRIRRWATERLEGRDAVSQAMESDDEAEKAEPMSSPEIHRSSSATRLSPAVTRDEVNMRDSAPPAMEAVVEVVEEQPQQQKQPEFVVPTQDTFTFQASHAYPNHQESYLNLDNLNLSDTHTTSNTTATSMPRSIRRHGNPPRSSSRNAANHLGRGAGQKRRLNLGEIFDLGSLGYGKDPFGSNGPKRSRHS